MQRFTISLDDDLALEFDRLMVLRGYENRSEAVRDLIRDSLDGELLAEFKAKWCVATATYVYDQHDHTVSARLRAIQHEHHDVVVSSLHTHLDHSNCMETVILRGRSDVVRACAQDLIALRGVRHGRVNLLPLEEEELGHHHHHDHGDGHLHKHLRPLN